VNNDDGLDIRKKWGHRIKEIRQYLKKSQEEVAEDVGIRQATVSEIENGTGNPLAITLYKIMDESLGVAEEEFHQYSKKPEELQYKKNKL
jgi:transcriptional regulator with XRE-family HTH domain